MTVFSAQSNLCMRNFAFFKYASQTVSLSQLYSIGYSPLVSPPAFWLESDTSFWRAWQTNKYSLVCLGCVFLFSRRQANTLTFINMLPRLFCASFCATRTRIYLKQACLAALKAKSPLCAQYADITLKVKNFRRAKNYFARAMLKCLFYLKTVIAVN